MSNNYLAFDFGASSGRAIVGRIKNSKIILEEIHRFRNGMTHLHGSYYWDVYRLYDEILAGLNACRKMNQNPVSLAIDTWGVDFTFLDHQGKLTGIPYAYRDHRTDGMMEKVFERIAPKKLYELTGVQFMQFNTLFQLFAAVHQNQIHKENISDLLFMPDILNYMLTGIKSTEFSFATTSQLFNPNSMSWEPEVFDLLGLPISMMQLPVKPGTVLGTLDKSLQKETGYKELKVISVASHDTGSAIAAIPATDDKFVYISSGTWSLMGIESENPLINEGSFRHSFTNEGGIDGTFRVLKNIMGLWLIQECNRIWASEGKAFTFAGLVEMAKQEKPFSYFIDPDDTGFLNPENMITQIQKYCSDTHQKIPESPASIARTIFESLAFRYRDTLDSIREISSKSIERIHIIGGGSENKLLCQFTANATGLPVVAGPAEGTALGNIMVQAQAQGEVKNRFEIREIIQNSFEFKIYEPRDTSVWEAAFEQFKQIFSRK